MVCNQKRKLQKTISEQVQRLRKSNMDYRHLVSRFNTSKGRIFLQPEELLKEAGEYFNWCNDYQLAEEKLFHYQGDVVRDEIKKVRAFTKKGLCNFIGITESRFESFRGMGEAWV